MVLIVFRVGIVRVKTVKHPVFVDYTRLPETFLESARFGNYAVLLPAFAAVEASPDCYMRFHLACTVDRGTRPLRDRV